MTIFSKTSSSWLKQQCKLLKIKLNKICLNNKKSLNNIKWKDGFYLINMAQSPPGTHWVAIAIPENKSEAMYFDSFGVIPDDSIINSLKKNMINKIYFNQYSIQSLRSEACGHFCLAFFIFLNKNGTDSTHFNKFLNFFGPYSRQNEQLLFNFLKKHLTYFYFFHIFHN